MARIIFPKGHQRAWLTKALDKMNLSYIGLAELCGFNPRTFNDWLREEYSLPGKAAKIITAKTRIKLPSNISKLKDFWNNPFSSKLGAKRRMDLYGPPGTLEGRKKGGHISQLRRSEYPGRYQNCNTRKEYKWPRKSKDLAELTGIILGDGSLTHDQIKVTLNYFVEKNYVRYVSRLFKQLLGEKPIIYKYRDKKIKVCNLTLSGIKLVEFFISLGLNRGNKIKRQAQVPGWIKANSTYSVATLKGLIDTDGGVYYHRHSNRFGNYFNLGLTFTSHSIPLLDFAHDTLIKQGFAAKKNGDGVYLYRLGEVLKYQHIIGFGNEHHKERLDTFLKAKLDRKGAGVV